MEGAAGADAASLASTTVRSGGRSCWSPPRPRFEGAVAATRAPSHHCGELGASRRPLGPARAPVLPSPAVSEPPSVRFATRLGFAFACFVRVLFDGAFAGRARLVRDAMPALPPAAQPKAPELSEPKTPEREPERKKPELAAPALAGNASALQLLALLQREGRLVDFLEQDIAAFPDADVGAAARVVHEGCRKALREHATIVALREEDEGAKVTLEAGFDASLVKLVGNVTGKGPYSGVLQHRGWKATRLELPTPVAAHDPAILAPAEVEL